MEIAEVRSQKSEVRSIKDFGRIGVLMGGPSSEREVSLKSGKAVYESLKQSGLDAVAVDIVTDNIDENIGLIGSYNMECAFLALHGRFGEDGQIQKLLEDMSIVYTGPGPGASALAMDKIESRLIFEANRLNVPKYQILCSRDFLGKNAFVDLSFPLVIKPAAEGSSIGLSIIDTPADLPQALKEASGFGERIIAEEYIAGREVTVGILDETCLPIVEVVPQKRFFDFEAKYLSGATEYIVPAKLEEKIARRIQESALAAYKLLGCSGCSRVDLILSEKNIPYILEVNTIPGFTKTSLLPKAAKAVGIDFDRLCVELVRLAYEKTKHGATTR